MADRIRGRRAGAGVIRAQQLRQADVALGPSAVCQDPSRIGCERAWACPRGELECAGLALARPIAKLAQRFRRVQPIGTTRISKRGGDLRDPRLALSIASRRLGQDAPDADSVLGLPAV